MRWERFTVMSQEAIQAAQRKAEELGHAEIRIRSTCCGAS